MAGVWGGSLCCQRKWLDAHPPRLWHSRDCSLRGKSESLEADVAPPPFLPSPEAWGVAGVWGGSLCCQRKWFDAHPPRLWHSQDCSLRGKSESLEADVAPPPFSPPQRLGAWLGSGEGAYVASASGSMPTHPGCGIPRIVR